MAMKGESLIIDLLSEGKTQPEISDILKAKGIHPNSLSSIEKGLKALRERKGAKTMFHLAIILAREKALTL